MNAVTSGTDKLTQRYCKLACWVNVERPLLSAQRTAFRQKAKTNIENVESTKPAMKEEKSAKYLSDFRERKRI